MNPILHIRLAVFCVSQYEMARIAGAGQASVSRWENGETAPTRVQLERIRSEAIRRAIPWDDRWFFEAPSEAAE